MCPIIADVLHLIPLESHPLLQEGIAAVGVAETRNDTGAMAVSVVPALPSVFSQPRQKAVDLVRCHVCKAVED